MNENESYLTRTIIHQIGTPNVLAISGGRWTPYYNQTGQVIGITLPVHYGYKVHVWLQWNDLYSVRRVFTRGTQEWEKGQVSDVFCEQVGQVAYEASCYRDPFGVKVDA